MLTFKLTGKVDAAIPFDNHLLLLIKAPDPDITRVRQVTCLCRDQRLQEELASLALYGKTLHVSGNLVPRWRVIGEQAFVELCLIVEFAELHTVEGASA